ncbi:hypothetical protein [Luteolibacter sp. Populi]|uniref:hypothetical protein n=1 Tax=Luteolibacter sp. Populi TaxID=3230487 RepID=UPI003467C177
MAHLYRREKRAFWWACGWLGLLFLAWVGSSIFAYFVQKRFAELYATAAGDYLPELDRYYNQVRPWLQASRVLTTFLAIGFSTCLIRWLSAIRRRRRWE